MPVTEARASRWEPVLQGTVYCSPACGRGCTRKQYDTAVADAAALVKQLGTGWTPRVWENLGWHYEAVASEGRLTVSQYVPGHYSAHLHYEPDEGIKWSAEGTTPEGAVQAVLAKAQNEIDRILVGISTVRLAIGGSSPST